MFNNRNLAIILMFGVYHPHAATVLMDYNDGGSDGIHDTAVQDGGFENAIDGMINDARSYAEMPNWENVGGSAAVTASRTNLASPVQGPRNVVLSTSRHPAQSLGHTIQAADEFQGSLMWLDAGSWDADDEVQMILFYTGDNSLTGPRTDLVAWNTGPRATLDSWETCVFAPTTFTDNNATGKQLMVRFEVAGDPSHFARIDNAYLEVNSAAKPPPLGVLLLTNLVVSSDTVKVEWNQPADRYIVVASAVPNDLPRTGLTVDSARTPATTATFSYDAASGFFQLATNIAAVSDITSPGLIAAVKEQSIALAPTNKVYDTETESIIGLLLSGQTFAVSELDSFTILKSLNLEGSSLTGPASLSSLTNLVWLNLSSNQFTSVALPGLPTTIEALDLENNEITTLSMIESLIHLRWLDLETNLVTDLSSIVANAANGGLGDGDELWVRGNPLSPVATNQILELQSTYKVKVIY